MAAVALVPARTVQPPSAGSLTEKRDRSSTVAENHEKRVPVEATVPYPMVTFKDIADGSGHGMVATAPSTDDGAIASETFIDANARSVVAAASVDGRTRTMATSCRKKGVRRDVGC